MIALSERLVETHGQKPATSYADAAVDLLEKIATRQAVVAVIGLGYVGLPLAVAFAESGFSVVGIDIDKKRVADLNSGQSHVSGVPSERIASLVMQLTS